MTNETAPSRALAALGAACALAPALLMWGFTVDDALISVRYAHHLAAGLGYRFNAQGPSTDGVTPLPWVLVLRLLVHPDPLTTLLRAKVLGVVAWTLAGGALGRYVGHLLRAPGTRRRHIALAAAALLVMALAFPLGAWAASGMETGLVLALATLAVVRLDRPKQAAFAAGVVAAFRPEMVVWAVTLSLGACVVRERGTRARASTALPHAGALAVTPFAACVALRLAVFGRPAPLAVLAKPGDLSHGALYTGAAALVLLLPVLAFAPVALVRGDSVWRARVLVLAFFAHALAVLAAGGDWMPYARLMVPVVPSLVVAFVELSRASKPAWTLARLALVTAFGVLVASRAAPAGRGVSADRTALIAKARPALAGARVVAGLDVGWLGASTDARIIDLAGLTDPAIAQLPGGHTSKRVDVAMLLDRGVDTVVVYSDVRAVEARLLQSELFADRFEAADTLPLGSKGASYTLYRRRR